MTHHSPIPDHPQQNPERKVGFLRTPFGWALCAFLAVAGVLLWVEHRAHVLENLPLLLLLICVGMHFFMHRSHGGHGGGSHDR